jgi:peptidoglycan hydrolase-like protein with peptidoglycan-binding domain
MVRQIQQALGITADGVFGPKTEQAVIKFQSQNNLVADGVVGRKTLEVLGILDSSLDSVLAIKTSNGLNIIRHHLPENEYIKSETPILNEYLFLHHTAGWENP